MSVEVRGKWTVTCCQREVDDGFGLCGGQEGVDTAVCAADEGRENEAGGNHAYARPEKGNAAAFHLSRGPALTPDLDESRGELQPWSA